MAAVGLACATIVGGLVVVMVATIAKGRAPDVFYVVSNPSAIQVGKPTAVADGHCIAGASLAVCESAESQLRELNRPRRKIT